MGCLVSCGCAVVGELEDKACEHCCALLWPHQGCTKPRAFKKLLFGLAFYHALILERRKFGAIGWNIPYEWMNSDLKTGIMQLRMYLEEQPNVPYVTLNSVVGDITYGGRCVRGVCLDVGSRRHRERVVVVDVALVRCRRDCRRILILPRRECVCAADVLTCVRALAGVVHCSATDAWDKRTNLSVLERYFCPEVMHDSYKFSDSGLYFAPPEGTLEAVRSYIDTLPLDDAPETFGLNDNADITLQQKETRDLMTTIVNVQPRSGGGSGSRNPDDIVMDMASDIASRLPRLFSTDQAHPQTFATMEDGSVNSLVRLSVPCCCRFCFRG